LKAQDYFKKPVDKVQITLLIANVLTNMALKKEENDTNTVHCILFAFYAIPLDERTKTTMKTLINEDINKRHSTTLLTIRFNL